MNTVWRTSISVLRRRALSRSIFLCVTESLVKNLCVTGKTSPEIRCVRYQKSLYNLTNRISEEIFVCRKTAARGLGGQLTAEAIKSGGEAEHPCVVADQRGIDCHMQAHHRGIHIKAKLAPGLPKPCYNESKPSVSPLALLRSTMQY